MNERDKLVIIFILLTCILIISLSCYSLLFIRNNIIQKEIGTKTMYSQTEYILCTVESTDSLEDYLKQKPEMVEITLPDNYTDAAVVRTDNNEKWIIIYNHDIPFSSIVIKGLIVYSTISDYTISEYSGIIVVTDMPNYSWPHLMLIKYRNITRFLTFLIFTFWISLLYISLSEWSRRA